jgi:hypothetical protein
MRKLPWPAAVVLILLACAGTESGTIAIITSPGDGGDPFTEPVCTSGDEDFCGPTPTKITISEITIENADGGTSDGNEPANVIGTAPYDGGAMITLPQMSSDDVEILQATAYDSADAAVIFGETLPVELGGADEGDGGSLPLFVQRVGQFAKMPSPFSSIPASPLAVVFEDRYILVADTSSTTAQLYDLLLWGLPEGADGGMTALTLPCIPSAIAPVAGTTVIVEICTDDSAELVDLSESDPPSPITAAPMSPENPCPNGWKDVAGGSTVIAPNGDAFIVGATRRTGSATSAVLEVPPTTEGADGGIPTVALSCPSLTTARTGATALWSGNTHGLVVVGGLTSDGGFAGIESATATASGDAGATVAFTCLQAPSSGLPTNAGVVAINETTLLMAGGTVGGRVAPILPIALMPSSVCAVAGSPEAGKDAGPDATANGDAGAETTIPLAAARGFIVRQNPTPAATPIFVGTESDGTTHAFLVSGSSVPFSIKEVPILPNGAPPLKATTAILSPVPSVIVIGGATTMESYQVAPGTP